MHTKGFEIMLEDLGNEEEYKTKNSLHNPQHKTKNFGKSGIYK